jgi:hypothetical protein
MTPVQSAYPGAQVAPQQALQTPVAQMPAAAVMGAPTQAGAAQQGIAVDLTPILQRIDAIGAELGRGLAAISADVEALKVVTGRAHVDGLQVLAAIHHIYGTSQQLGQMLQAEKVATLDDFRRYLTPKYTGNP